MVGSRAATGYGAHVAGEIRRPGRAGWTIISGGAYGIDAAAHAGAGDQSHHHRDPGLRRRPAYPVGHAELFADIAGPGLIVSEWPRPASRPDQVLVRNRTIAALSGGTVIVEAGDAAAPWTPPSTQLASASR